MPIVAGSDAGSYGVPHSSALIDEMLFHHRAGLTVEQVLALVTSVPRRLWQCESADIVEGNAVDMVILAGDPKRDVKHLRDVVAVGLGERRLVTEPTLA